MALIPYPLLCGDTSTHIYGHPTFSGRPATSVLFLLHGYPANARNITPVVNRIFNVLVNKSRGLRGSSCNNLFIVTLESNSKLKPPTDNDSIGEAEHVYKAQGIPVPFSYSVKSLSTGVPLEQLASVVSSLIDLLPRVLHSNSSEVINTWLVAGLGLGAHAAWMVMDRDPRLHACIPILGSPDFLDIATSRSLSNFPLLSSYMTRETREYILKHDPISRPATSERPNPFLNKQILAIVGAQDTMIPLLPTRQFLDRINVGPLGTKRLVIQEGVGHQCTQEMIVQMAEFIWDVALA
ncbi:unnamed protein product [Rhizoctonia solani]|uniref:Uncharacterized protein n=1 Tax=Rhizoctonia solani TaxID=456999 RepID=A0A8H2XJC0_9AGAM|nr:unnamed protein product [Rhizoctonia solani]